MTESQHTPAERQSAKRYMIGMAGAAVAYVALIVFLPATDDIKNPALGIAVALLPLVPVVWMCLCVIAFIRRGDERQRAASLASFAIGFGVTILAAVTIGLLEGAGVSVPSAPWWIFLAGMTAWPIALVTLQLRAAR